MTCVAPEWNGATRRHVPHMLSENVAENVAATRAYIRGSFAHPPSRRTSSCCWAVRMMVPLAARRSMLAPLIDMDASLAALDGPSLVVHGAEDAVILPDMARYTAKRICRAHFGLYDGSGHAPFYESPERFNRSLIELLKEIRT